MVRPQTLVGRDKVVAEILSNRKKRLAVQAACGITHQAVLQWRQVPVRRVLTIAPVLFLEPWEIRPDFFARPRRRERKREAKHGGEGAAETP